MVVIVQATFTNDFPERKDLYIDSHFMDEWFQRIIWQWFKL